MIRNHVMLWTLSIGFELMELTFQHLLPNFNECWWDRCVPGSCPGVCCMRTPAHSACMVCRVRRCIAVGKLCDACAVLPAQLAAGRPHLQLAGHLGGHAHGEVVWVRPERLGPPHSKPMTCAWLCQTSFECARTSMWCTTLHQLLFTTC